MLSVEAVFLSLRPSPESLGLIAEICGYATVCGNHLDFLDAGHCLDFKDTRPVTISNSRACALLEAELGRGNEEAPKLPNQLPEELL